MSKKLSDQRVLWTSLAAIVVGAVTQVNSAVRAAEKGKGDYEAPDWRRCQKGWSLQRVSAPYQCRRRCRYTS